MPLSFAMRSKVDMAFSLLPVSTSKRGLSGSHWVTQKRFAETLSATGFTLGTSDTQQHTHKAETDKDCHWYGGQAEKPPPAQSGHHPQSQEDL